MTDEMTDEFCRLIELCGKFTYDVVECLFSCLQKQGEGKFTMDELILSLPDKERQLTRLSILKLDSRKYPRLHTSKERPQYCQNNQRRYGLITSLVLDSYSIIKNRWNIYRDWKKILCASSL
jgi:hypothetical protein